MFYNKAIEHLFSYFTVVKHLLYIFLSWLALYLKQRVVLGKGLTDVCFCDDLDVSLFT